MPSGPLAELAHQGAVSVRDSFAAYQLEFQRLTRRARRRFEERDWSSAHADALERLDLRPRCLAQAVHDLRRVLGDGPLDAALGPAMKAAFAGDLAGRHDPELAKTFFNSATRRVFGTVGVVPESEFTVGEVEVPTTDGGPIHAVHASAVSVAAAVEAALRAHAFAVPWRDLAADASLAAAEIARAAPGSPPDAIEFLRPVFFRGKGAYLVGRLRRGDELSPCIMALLHGEGGVYVDAVLLTPQEASVVFSFTRSYFHVEVDRPGALIAFLKSLLPQKKTSELYIAIGYNKHGKTVLYREIVEDLARTRDRFEHARGVRGMVMIVFTLPSLDVVFKVIRDRFAPPKTITRADVVQKYALVFRHDRAGRLVDAQEFEHLVLERDRFAPALLRELLEEAGATVEAHGDRVLIRHLYAERRVEPLDLFIRERDPEAARDALLDYGQAIRDLAATNTFPGDLLLKNFGVTRTGRVIFYDYDELCLVTDCNFRDIPVGTDDDDSGGEPWFFVGKDDVFPEEFLRFLGLPPALCDAFVAAHGPILTAGFWRAMQARIRAGEIVDIFPYGASRRLRRGQPAALAIAE